MKIVVKRHILHSRVKFCKNPAEARIFLHQQNRCYNRHTFLTLSRYHVQRLKLIMLIPAEVYKIYIIYNNTRYESHKQDSLNSLMVANPAIPTVTRPGY